MEPDRYTILTKTTDHSFHMIFYAGTFEDLPNEARHQGPWTNERFGDVAKLKLEYRLELARKGWVNVNEHPLNFEPEA